MPGNRHLTGDTRTRVSTALATRYYQGETIQGLALATGYSHFFIRTLLLEASVVIRPAGRPKAAR